MTASGAETSLLFEEELPQLIRGRGLIHIGTSGYSFKGWRGSFYPKGLTQDKWLEYYARHFDVVEINATYYRTLPASTFQSMVDRTPISFGFWVKVPGDVTHKDGNIAHSMKPFLESMKPLEQAGRLKGLLAQFPHSFHQNSRSLDKLTRLKDRVKSINLAVEFRHNSWQNDDILKFFDECKLIHVSVDLPELHNLPKPDIHTAGQNKYVRFHGRNKKTWYNPQLGDRYDYDYSEVELKKWISKIKILDEEGSTAYLFFNNCHAGQAVKNARMLRQLLELEFEN